MMVLLLLLLLLLMMVMTVTVQGCTVVVVASGYRGVTLERNSVGNDGVATGGMTSTTQIYGVGVIVAVGGGQCTTTANYDIVVVLKASIVVVVVDYDASVASGDTTADCAWIAGRVASGDYVMLRRMGRQMLLQNKLVGRLHRDC